MGIAFITVILSISTVALLSILSLSPFRVDK